MGLDVNPHPCAALKQRLLDLMAREQRSGYLCVWSLEARVCGESNVALSLLSSDAGIRELRFHSLGVCASSHLPTPQPDLGAS